MENKEDDLTRERLELEKQKLEFEKQKFEFEKSKSTPIAAAAAKPLNIGGLVLSIIIIGSAFLPWIVTSVGTSANGFGQNYNSNYSATISNPTSSIFGLICLVLILVRLEYSWIGGILALLYGLNVIFGWGIGWNIGGYSANWSANGYGVGAEAHYDIHPDFGTYVFTVCAALFVLFTTIIIKKTHNKENRTSITPDINTIIIAITIAIPVAVTTLHFLPKPDHVPDLIKHCPLLNAVLNGTCTVLLVTSYIAILNKKRNLHKWLNVTAFSLSALFLLSYVAYHSFGKETLFPKDNPLRPVYLFILTSHIILAAVVLPMVLLSFYRGLTNQVAKHRKLARWTLPIWLYVTTTGVVVYLMISPYYNF